MAEIVFNGKPLTVNPLKVSQPMGAALALLGMHRAIPLEHGAQGCTAFSKVFFTRHFREPVPLQTTAMSHLVTVMGADQHIIEALETLSDRERPDLIGLVTTGLSELQGADVGRALEQFRERHPEHRRVQVVTVNTPDTLGSLESGYALAVEAMIRTLVPESRKAGQHPWQVNVLASSMLTPGDIEALRAWIEAYGLHPLFLPDLSGSMDGHLDPEGFCNLTQGGLTQSELGYMGKSVATLVVGASMAGAADLLRERTGIPDHRFESLMGLADCDAFSQTLAALAGASIPRSIERIRAQLMDAMVDCHIVLGGARVALAADPDLLTMLGRFVTGLGAELCAAVTSARAPVLASLPAERVWIGDLEDLEGSARRHDAQILLASSHGVPVARRLGIPILRAGFPIHDAAGAQARQWVGYGGSRQALFDLTNLLMDQRQNVRPYRSIFWQGSPRDGEPLPAQPYHPAAAGA